MGAIRSAVGHLCIDLSHVELTGNEQRELLQTVQEAVIGYLANVASTYKVVTISLSQNNGAGDREEEEEPMPHDPLDEPSEPDEPTPDKPSPLQRQSNDVLCTVA